MNRRVLHTPEEAAIECGRHILVRLEDAMAAGARATLAISGGTSPKPMFAYFARTDFAWSRVHLFWVDERCVPPDHPQSNFKMARDAWLAPARFPAANIHRIRAELPPQEAAQDYAADIRRYFSLDEGELPNFEVVHLGMGSDAHTASLFPGEAKIDDRKHIAAAVWSEPAKQWRVTLLPGVLEAARHKALLVTGADKIKALDAVLHAPYDPKRYPVQLVAGEGSGAVWFLDEAAGRQLSGDQP
jgi:6-phosphogluconolactonase